MPGWLYQVLARLWNFWNHIQLGITSSSKRSAYLYPSNCTPGHFLKNSFYTHNRRHGQQNCLQEQKIWSWNVHWEQKSKTCYIHTMLWNANDTAESQDKSDWKEQAAKYTLPPWFHLHKVQKHAKLNNVPCKDTNIPGKTIKKREGIITEHSAKCHLWVERTRNQTGEGTHVPSETSWQHAGILTFLRLNTYFTEIVL